MSGSHRDALGVRASALVIGPVLTAGPTTGPVRP